MNTLTLHQYKPGVEKDVVHHHTLYYEKNWDFDDRFTKQVKRELSEFLTDFDASLDAFWWAARGNDFSGAVVVDGTHSKENTARLRWFIVPESVQGEGVGGILLDQAIQHCRSKGFATVYLWTFGGLAAARQLYERQGFRLTESKPSTEWGPEIIEQKLELSL